MRCNYILFIRLCSTVGQTRRVIDHGMGLLVACGSRGSGGRWETYMSHAAEPAHHAYADDAGPRIFISAAEPSADEHAANLIQAFRTAHPEYRFEGVAGPRMVAAGCEPIFDMTRHSAMLLGALGAARQAWRMLALAGERLRMKRFDAAVVVDSPTLHLPLAARAKASGVPVMYFIAPQLWAWGGWRIYKLRHNVEQLACILPFEEEYFRNQGVNARFVGHPLADKLAAQPVDEAEVARLRSNGSPMVALLPGSRRHVVSEVLPGQVEVAAAITRAFPGATFVASVANPQTKPIVHEAAERSRLSMIIHDGPVGEAIRAADLVLVASGTSALEVAFHERPMIVMYNASRVFYHLVARWVIRTTSLSLPNILAGREVVPEFMPYYRSTAPIADVAIRLLDNAAERERMVAELREIVAPLRNTRASQAAAELLERMIARHRAGGH